MLQDISTARHDVCYQKLITHITKCEVLVLDDLLISPLLQNDPKELPEIVVDRYDRKVTIVTN